MANYQLLTLPDAVLLHLATSFLLDAEAICYAQSCRIVFHALQSYKFKSLVHVKNALDFANDNNSSSSSMCLFESIGRQRMGMVTRVLLSGHNRGWSQSQQLHKLPKSVTELCVVGQSMYRGTLDSLPSTLCTLTIDDPTGYPFVFQPRQGWQLPASLTHLQAGHYWHRLDNLQLPIGLKTLILSPNRQYRDECVKLPLSLPNALTRLDLGCNWNGTWLPPLPQSLTELNLGCYAGLLSKVQLPESVERLQINSQFDGEPFLFDLRLPTRLRSLRLGVYFNCLPLPGVVLPASLTELYVDPDNKYFNQPLECLHLPEGLLSLHLPHCFNQPLELPTTLTELQFGNSRVHSSAYTHPLCLEHTSLHVLDMSRMERWHLDCERNLRLPSSLHTLILHPLGVLTASINTLFTNSHVTHLDITNVIGHCARHALMEVRWPPHLCKLTFGAAWTTQLTDAHWKPPASLVELHLPRSDTFEQHPVSSLLLPSSLQVLHVHNRRTSLRLLRLPCTLRELHLGSSWNLTTSKLPKLPPNLRVLAFGRGFNQQIRDLALPQSLRVLSLSQHFGLQSPIPWNHPEPCSSMSSVALGKLLPPLPVGLRVLHGGRSFLDTEFT
jgi:hypothetical protein